MKVLLGALAHNQHVVNIAQAFHEAGCLGLYYTGAVDHFGPPWSRSIRRRLGRLWPGLESRMARRKITAIPEEYLRADWTWAGLGLLAGRLGLNESGLDWIWDKSECSFDRKCARLIRRSAFDVFCGVEYGCLEAISAAQQAGKKTMVAFLSPHHRTLEEWVFAEYERFPELLTPYVQRLRRLLQVRTARKDQEARSADCIHVASEFTARSLVSAGLPREKMTVIPLGCNPPAVSPAGGANESLSGAPPAPVRFMYAGHVSVGKGAHYLLQSWKTLAPARAAELHFYGRLQLPKRCFDGVGDNVFLHGAVSQEELNAAYRRSSVLVFPTLCDGFGLVVGEAFAQGLPVLTTSHAGAAELIDEGRNGFVIPPRSVDALVERMDWCLRHPAALLEMRRHALATAARCTWDRFRAEFWRQTSPLLDRAIEVEAIKAQ